MVVYFPFQSSDAYFSAPIVYARANSRSGITGIKSYRNFKIAPLPELSKSSKNGQPKHLLLKCISVGSGRIELQVNHFV